MESLPGLHQQWAVRRADRERKRAAKACDGCRRQKEKCDDGVPCRRCFRLGRKCEYSGRGSRGAGVGTAAPPGGASASSVTGGPGPVPGAEILPSTPSASVGPESTELSQRVAYLERVVQHYAGNIRLDSDSLRTLAENAERQRPLPHPEPPVHASSNSSDFAGVDEENFCIKPLENNITHYSGEFSHWNFSMRIKQWIDQSVVDDGANQTSNNSIREYYRAEELQSPSKVSTSTSSLPPRYVADFLAQAFFKHAEANYFYVEQRWLSEKLDVMYDNPASLTRRDVGAVCVIFSVLAIGTQYVYLESYAEQANDIVEPSVQDPVEPGPFSEDSIGVMFYRQACQLLPDVITVSSLESVQACLLLGIYTLPLDASGLSYVYLNLAVKLGIQNGMHRKYPGEGLDPSVRETRNRVWWTAYTIERRVGIFHGRPISISSADVDADLPVDKTDMWPTTTPIHTAHFLATLHLNQILSKMSHEILILRTYTKQELTNGLGRLVELRRGLASWWESLPEDVFCKEPTSQTPVTRQGLHLKLEYCLVRIFVGRAFIFPREQSRNSASSASPASQTATEQPRASSSSNKTNPRALLVADCIEASLAVVNTCRLLRSTVGLARASYTEFSACRAALLVITTQCLQKKKDHFRVALRDGLSFLKEMSAGGESARSEMSLIEAFERAIAKIDAGEKTDSEYSRFKKWEQLWKSDPSARERMGEAAQEVVAPQLAGLWRSPEGVAQQGTVPMPSYTPFFGMDGNFASFPQTLDEFSSVLGYGFWPSPDNVDVAGVEAESAWMGST